MPSGRAVVGRCRNVPQLPAMDVDNVETRPPARCLTFHRPPGGSEEEARDGAAGA